MDSCRVYELSEIAQEIVNCVFNEPKKCAAMYYIVTKYFLTEGEENILNAFLCLMFDTAKAWKGGFGSEVPPPWGEFREHLR